MNQYIEYHHFKMDTLQTAISMIRPFSYFASVDIKDAYYCLPIDETDQKYLKFMWKGVLYKYTCLPNGLGSAPRIFTKVMKVVFSELRAQGYESVSYIDDCWLQGKDFTSCQENVFKTVQLLQSLGFIIHPTKSTLMPSQSITFLGFIRNSVDMTVKLCDEKALHIKSLVQKLLHSPSTTIREVAKVIGTLVASFPGVKMGPLYFRQLEIEKANALKHNKGCFDKTMTLSPLAIQDLEWWEKHVETTCDTINKGSADIILESDSSSQGYGIVYKDKANGLWTDQERSYHINYLELKGAFLALKSFCTLERGQHVHLKLCSNTAVKYINSMGGSHSLECNALAREMWLWASDRNLWLSSSHVPGILHVTADRESRVFNIDGEWMLNPLMFQKLHTLYKCGFTVDLFASRIDNQLPSYYSWRADPSAKIVDAFSVPWTSHFFYAFPPFCLIPKVLQKISQERATGVVIVPNWKTQTWYPTVIAMCLTEPILLSRHKELLLQPHNNSLIHPLWRKLDLLACHLSGKHAPPNNSHQVCKKLSASHGGQAHQSNTQPTYKSGQTFAHKKGRIQFSQVLKLF